MQKSLLHSGRTRLQLDLTSIGIPEIPLIGVNHTRHASPGLIPHIHPGAMEICYLVRGERTYNVGNRDYTFHGNQVFVTMPDELHGSGGHMHGKGLLYWIQVKLPGRRRSFLGLSPDYAGALVTQLREIPQRKFRGKRSMQRLFEDAMLLARRPDGDILVKLKVSLAIVKLLLEVIHAAADKSLALITPDIEEAMKTMKKSMDKPLRIMELASAARLSLSRFKAKFKEQVGIPPGEYFLRKKVALARQLLLNTDQPITGIAYDLGFSSSQYFATVFKRFTNLTPKQARGRGTMRSS